MNKIIVLLFSAIAFGSYAQLDSAQALIQKSDHFYNQGKYLESGRAFESAVQLLDADVNWLYRYNGMCSWALAHKVDTAFMYLEILANDSDYTEYNHIIQDSDLKSMHQDLRWEPLTLKVKAHKDFKERDYNQELILRLETLRNEDQKWRNMHNDFMNGKVDTNLFTKDEIYKNMVAADSNSHVAIVQIMEKFGFPGFNLVGKSGSNNFWLLVQHQDRFPELQRKVLKLMKVEIDKENADKSNFAYLTDRVAVNANEPQVYGTQMTVNEERTSYIPKEVIDPEHLNERRASVGLGTIEEYAERMNEIFAGSLNNK